MTGLLWRVTDKFIAVLLQSMPRLCYCNFHNVQQKELSKEKDMFVISAIIVDIWKIDSKYFLQ